MHDALSSHPIVIVAVELSVAAAVIVTVVL